VLIRLERLRRRDRWRYSPRRRLRSVDAIPIDRPIFVLGLQGGGTTLAARTLLRHPAVVSMSGNSSYWVATDELGFVRNRMAALPPSLWSSSHRTDLDHPLFGTEHHSMWACDELLPAYRRVAEDATPADAQRFKRLLREHVAVYARARQSARFVDKTHTYTVKIPYLDALLAGCDAYFLLVLRNPYALCDHVLRRKPPSWRSVPRYEEQLALAAEHWENAFRIALEDGERTGRFASVRFEDFVRSPERVVRALCRLVDLPYRPDLVPRPGDRMPFATLPGDTKWYPLRTPPAPALAARSVDLIAARCGSLAERLGYTPGGEVAPGDPSLLLGE
jgi:Sulfotransferase family